GRLELEPLDLREHAFDLCPRRESRWNRHGGAWRDGGHCAPCALVLWSGRPRQQIARDGGVEIDVLERGSQGRRYLPLGGPLYPAADGLESPIDGRCKDHHLQRHQYVVVRPV